MLKKMVKLIPNILTTSRGVGGLVLPFLFFTGNVSAAFAVLLIASSTDLFDGFLARILKAESKYGKVVDAISDKILSATSLIITTFINPLMALPLVLESLISVVNIANKVKNKIIVDSSSIGKIKSVGLFSTILASFLTVNPAVILPLILLTTVLQVVTLKGYVNVFTMGEKEERQIKIEETNIKNSQDVSLEEKALDLTLKKKTVKEKYLELRRSAKEIVNQKEAWERNLGDKIEESVKRELKK